MNLCYESSTQEPRHRDNRRELNLFIFSFQDGRQFWMAALIKETWPSLGPVHRYIPSSASSYGILIPFNAMLMN